MRRQHGVIARRQLLALGMDRSTIQRRLNAGRLHPVWRGVYAVGRPDLTAQGRWMAAVLTCGDGAVLSHASAAALWGIRPGKPPDRRERSADGSPQVHVSVSRSSRFRRRGIRVHRPALLGVSDTASHDRIPATSPARTLIDLGTCLSASQLEAAVSRAGKEGLVAPEALRSALARCSSLQGAAAVRRILEREDFVLADTELERLFVPLARRAGLPVPLTGRRVNGFEVDFFWPELGLVVEADGLQWHRTPGQQTKDRQRDQAHSRRGLTPLRFTHWQVAHEPRNVSATLREVAGVIRSGNGLLAPHSE
ncbi:MAG: DUF559 domain-containing protein [Solirubrobacterales bacterium]